MANLQVTVLPADATDKTFTVTSDRPDVVSVDGMNCEAKAAGTAILTITTTDGGHTSQCTVTVNEATKNVESVSVAPAQKEVAVGETFSVNAGE